jgi:hypothetical protein
LILILELCKFLFELPSIIDRTEFWNLLKYITDKAKAINSTSIINWLKNKEGDNSWVLEYVSRATSEMAWEDWYSTSNTTNIAESVHAHSQRDGTRLTLVAAIQCGRQLDKRFLEGEHIGQSFGIISKYGNNSVTGRATKNLARAKAAAKKKQKQDPKLQQQQDVLNRAQDLIHQGLSLDIMELFLKTERQKQITSDS